MVKCIKYHDNWKSAVLHCPKCGWKGAFEEGNVEFYRELMDSSCPICDKMLAVVWYPKKKSKKKLHRD